MYFKDRVVLVDQVGLKVQIFLGARIAAYTTMHALKHVLSMQK